MELTWKCATTLSATVATYNELVTKSMTFHMSAAYSSSPTSHNCFTSLHISPVVKSSIQSIFFNILTFNTISKGTSSSIYQIDGETAKLRSSIFGYQGAFIIYIMLKGMSLCYAVLERERGSRYQRHVYPFWWKTHKIEKIQSVKNWRRPSVNKVKCHECMHGLLNWRKWCMWFTL